MRARQFHFGEWLVDSQACTVRHDADTASVAVEPRAMDVLIALCTASGEILSTDELLRLCWDGIVVGENQVHKAIAQLRRVLRDSAGDARYIENIRKRGYRTVAPVQAIVGGSHSPVAESWIHDSPFVGLDAFGEDHAKVFFGRDSAVAGLRRAFLAQIDARRAFTLVLGPSGSGKTSLVQAGLLPSLQQDGREFRLADAIALDLGDVGALPLTTAIGGALLDLEIDGGPLLEGYSAERLGDLLAETSGTGLPEPLRAVVDGHPIARSVLFIDRLEAVFDSATIDDRQRRRFLTALDRLAGSGTVAVIAACRNDFYPSVAGEPLLMGGKAEGGHFDLAPPTRAEIAQMIRLPALAAGLHFGVDPESKAQLDDILCEDSANAPDALPLLQYTLQELYLQRTSNRELTIAAYRALGGIGGAIGRRAEATLNELPEASRLSLPGVLSLSITIGGADDAVRSRRIPWSALTSDDERRLVRIFVQQRLFVSHVYDGEPVFGVAHESMLRQWPRAARWIADHRQALNARSRLEGSTRRWMIEDRRGDLLLPAGKLLEEARELIALKSIPLSAEVATFVSASVGRARRAERRRLGASIGFAAIAVVAMLLGMQANRAETVAERRTHQAEDLMGFMVGNFADKLRPLGRLDLLADIGQKALSYFDDSRQTVLSSEARQQEARALETIAEVARARADPKTARDALLLAKTLLEAELAQNTETADLLKNLGADAFWLGQISYDQGKLDDAEDYFQQYRRYSERMAARDPEDVDAWIEMSYATNSLGSVEQARGDNHAAAAAFEASVAEKRRALVRRPDDRDLRAGLADSLSWLGSTRQTEGELHAAFDLFEQEIAELTALKDAAPSEFQWTYRLVAALHRHVLLLDAMGKDDDAMEDLHRAKAMAQSLTAHDPSNRTWQWSLLNLDVAEGELLSGQGRLDEALALQNATDARLASLTSIDPANLDSRHLQAVDLIEIGVTLLELNRPKEAYDRLAAIVERLRSERAQTGPSVDLDQRLAKGLIQLGQAARALHDPSSAVAACTEAISLIQPIILGHAKDYHLEVLSVYAHFCLDQRDEVSETITWLSSIGYYQKRYQQIISQI